MIHLLFEERTPSTTIKTFEKNIENFVQLSRIGEHGFQYFIRFESMHLAEPGSNTNNIRMPRLVRHTSWNEKAMHIQLLSVQQKIWVQTLTINSKVHSAYHVYTRTPASRQSHAVLSTHSSPRWFVPSRFCLIVDWSLSTNEKQRIISCNSSL